MEQGADFIRGVTGEWLIYPGHPLVLAQAIMEVFPDCLSSNKPTENGWRVALVDHQIPGAADHVGAAMRCLKIVSEGGTAEQMIEYATCYWVDGKAGGHQNNVQAGIEQVAAIECWQALGHSPQPMRRSRNNV